MENTQNVSQKEMKMQHAICHNDIPAHKEVSDKREINYKIRNESKHLRNGKNNAKPNCKLFKRSVEKFYFFNKSNSGIHPHARNPRQKRFFLPVIFCKFIYTY